jgi:hypothetical protein
MNEPRKKLSNKEIEEVWVEEFGMNSEGWFENQAIIDQRIYQFPHRYVGV